MSRTVTTPAVGRIQDKTTFRALRRPAGRGAHGPIRVSYVPPRPDGPPFPLVGYAISRRCGNAVTRNRLRRRLRATLAARADVLAPGSYLVRTEPGAAALAYDELASSVSTALGRLGRPGRAPAGRGGGR